MAEKRKDLADIQAPNVSDFMASQSQGDQGDATPIFFNPLQVPYRAVGSMLQSLATLPGRLYGAVDQLRNEGTYNPSPALEAAMLTMGATPLSAPRGALGAGPSGDAYKKMIDEIIGILPSKEVLSPAEQFLQTHVGKLSPTAEAALKSIVGKTTAPTPHWQSMYTPKEVAQVKKTIGDYAANADLSFETVDNILSQSRPQLERQDVRFQPYDWRADVSPHATEFARNIPQQAVEAGFNPNFPLFKGRVSERPSHQLELPNPAEKSREPGLFFAEHPGVAKEYGRVTQYVSRATNPAQIDWSAVVGSPYYTGADMHEILKAAQAQGIDLLKIKNIEDLAPLGESSQSQFVVMKPQIVRFPNAQFNPGRLEESNLLSSLAGLGLLGGGGIYATQNR